MHAYIQYGQYIFIVCIVYLFRAVQHNVVFQKLFYGRRIKDCREYTPASRMTLIQYGSATVREITLIRKPIQTYVNTLMNVLTRGKFNDFCRKFKYNNIFHISILFTLDLPNSRRVYTLLEKTQIIHITTADVISGPPCEYLAVQAPHAKSFLDMVRAVQATEGENFFNYDFLDNNCQTFAQNFLKANHIYDPSVHDEFILQDINSLHNELPKYVRSITNIAVSIRAHIDKFLEGIWMEYLMPAATATPEPDCDNLPAPETSPTSNDSATANTALLRGRRRHRRSS